MADKLKNVKNKEHNNNNIEIKMVKKTNLSISDCFMAQLCQIPGISKIIASCIKEKYNTLYNFYNELSNISNKIEILENITYISSKNKTLKIGKAKAIKLNDYLFTLKDN